MMDLELPDIKTVQEEDESAQSKNWDRLLFKENLKGARDDTLRQFFQLTPAQSSTQTKYRDVWTKITRCLRMWGKSGQGEAKIKRTSATKLMYILRSAEQEKILRNKSLVLAIFATIGIALMIITVWNKCK